MQGSPIADGNLLLIRSNGSIQIVNKDRNFYKGSDAVFAIIVLFFYNPFETNREVPPH